MAGPLMCPTTEQYGHSPQNGILKGLQFIDPFSYWVQCQSCLDFKKIHDNLRQCIQSHELVDFTPENGDWVIVKDFDYTYYRGYISSCLEEDYFTVFLIDKYVQLTVSQADIYPLPTTWQNIQEQGHLIQIYGVIPSSQMSSQKLVKWKSNLNNALCGAREFQLEDICVIADNTFGRILTLNGSSVIGLDEILLNLQFAVPSLDFEKDIITSWKHNQKKLREENVLSTFSSPTSYDDYNRHTWSYFHSRRKNDFKISPQHAISIRAHTKGCVLTTEHVLKDPKQQSHLDPDEQLSLIESARSRLSTSSDHDQDVIFENSFKDMKAMEEESRGKQYCSSGSSNKDKSSASERDDFSSRRLTKKTYNRNSSFHSSQREKLINNATRQNFSNSNNQYKDTVKDKQREKQQSSFLKQSSFNKSSLANYSSDSSSKDQSIEVIGQFPSCMKQSPGNRPERQSKHDSCEPKRRSQPAHCNKSNIYQRQGMFLSDGARGLSSNSNYYSSGKEFSKTNLHMKNETVISKEDKHRSQELSIRGAQKSGVIGDYSRNLDRSSPELFVKQIKNDLYIPLKNNKTNNNSCDNDVQGKARHRSQSNSREKDNHCSMLDSNMVNTVNKNIGGKSQTKKISSDSSSACDYPVNYKTLMSSEISSHEKPETVNTCLNVNYDTRNSRTIKEKHSIYSTPAQQKLNSLSFQKCSSTPNDHDCPSHCSENDISPICGNYLEKSIDISEKVEDGVFMTQVSQNQDNLKFKGRSTKSKTKKRRKKKYSSMPLDDKQTPFNTSTYPKNDSLLHKGLGRGKLLQIIAESKSKYDSSHEILSKKLLDVTVSEKDTNEHLNSSEVIFSTSTAVDKDETMLITNKKLYSPSSYNMIEENNPVTDESKDSNLITESIVPTTVENDHEDRYFYVEPPKLLNCPLDETSVTTTNESKKEEKKEFDSPVYEELLQENSELEPVDTSKSIETNALQLEKEILSEYSISRITDRMKLSCGIIHGNIKSQPAIKISELQLHKHIFTNINKKKMSELTRSQMYAIPVLLQRRNLVLIGPPNSGKTLAYVIPTLSLLLNENYYTNIKKGNGPRCVFVTNCSQNANYISQFCSAICGAKLTIITTYGGGLELERKVELTNGCEVLVTTPRCWLRLLQHTSVTNLSRLCHVVFDDADELFERFSPEILEITNELKKMIHIRKRECPIEIQLVIVGEKWAPVLEDCLKSIDSPVLCITSHLEAALYARIKPITYILPSGAKVEKLKDLLHSTPKKLRTVIVCRSAAEVKMLRPVLELSMSNVLIAHEDMNLTLICDVSNKWVRTVTPPTLLCSDSILGELAVTNAQRLIHFSLPDNKSFFSERFATIKDHFYDRIKYPKSVPPDCIVEILVDTGNEDQFPEIVCLMERLSTPIPKYILDTVKKIHVQKEEAKADMMICERILMFGKCWKKEKCKRRHIFNKLQDFNPSLPQSGMVKVKLLHVHNPSHYSVRILETKVKQNEPWEKVTSSYCLLGMKLGNYYSRRENRIPHGRVNVGDIVGIEVDPDILFKRAMVIEIISRDEKLNPINVLINYIDEGSVTKCKAILLLHLPRELQNLKPEAYDMFLTGLQPVDYDNEWSFAAVLKLRKSLESLSLTDEDNFFIAKIVFTTGTNMIASSFHCYEWLELNKCFILLFSPRKFILDTRLAVSNNEHLPTLLDLALEGGLISSYPKDIQEDEDEFSNEEQIQWAHLEKDKYFPTCVVNAVTPSLFYLKNSKYSDRVSILQKDLTSSLNDKIIKPDVIRPNMVCAIKNPVDNDWNRGILLEILENFEAEVFCVDYGDSIVVPLSNLSLLPKGFVSRLPFQALECSLVGIVPLNGDWASESIDCFYWLTGDENNVLKPLYAKVCEVKQSAETTGGQHYQVILVDLSTSQEVVLNKELVYKGFANWDPITKSYLSEPIDIPGDGDVIGDDINKNIDVGDDSDTEVWTPELCNKVKHPEENECSQNKVKTDKDDEKCELFNDLIESIKEGDFDFEFTPQGLFENMFFPKDRIPLERGLPAPPNLQNETVKEISENDDSIVGQILQNLENNRLKAIEFGSNEPEVSHKDSASHNNEKTQSEIDSESDSESTGSQGTSASFLSKVFDPICHPSVLWSQNVTHVKLKVDVPEITVYEVTYSVSKLCFQAHIDNKYYWFNLDFFGPICPKTVECKPKGLYFDIKLEKYVKGEKWPRLTYKDEKNGWIKVDPDSFSIKSKSSVIDSYIERGEKMLHENKHPCKVDFENVFALQGPDTDSDYEFEASDHSETDEYFDLRDVELEVGDQD